MRLWEPKYSNCNGYLEAAIMYLGSGSSLRAGAAESWGQPGGGRGGPGDRPDGDALPHGPGHGRWDGRLLHHVNSQYCTDLASE